MTLLAQLPDATWIVIGCSVIGALALFGIVVGLNFLQGARRSIAEELRSEMEKASEAQKVAVQQPLEVREHISYATTTEMAALKEDVEQLRKELRDGIDKLSDERRTSVGNLHSKVDAANKKVDELGGQLQVISQQVGLVLNRLLNNQ